MNSIYDDIGQTCILLYYACILRTMIKLCKSTKISWISTLGKFELIIQKKRCWQTYHQHVIVYDGWNLSWNDVTVVERFDDVMEWCHRTDLEQSYHERKRPGIERKRPRKLSSTNQRIFVTKQLLNSLRGCPRKNV